MPRTSPSTCSRICRVTLAALLLLCIWALLEAGPGGGAALAQDAVITSEALRTAGAGEAAASTAEPPPWWLSMGGGGLMTAIGWGIWRLIASGKGALTLRLGGGSAEEEPAAKPQPPPPPAGSAVKAAGEPSAPALPPGCKAHPDACQISFLRLNEQVAELREQHAQESAMLEGIRADVALINEHLQEERAAQQRRAAAEEAVALATERVADALEKRDRGTP